MDYDIFKLPRILKIQFILAQLIFTVLQWIPVSIVSLNWTDVVILNIKAELIVHVVSFNKASLLILQSPSYSSNNSRGHLKGSRILIWDSCSCILDGQLRTIPIGIFGVSVQKDTKFVHTRNNFFLKYFPILLFWNFTSSHNLTHRSQGIRGWMVGIVTGWPIDYLISLLNCEELCNTKAFIMRNEVSKLRT